MNLKTFLLSLLCGITFLLQSCKPDQFSWDYNIKNCTNDTLKLYYDNNGDHLGDFYVGVRGLLIPAHSTRCLLRSYWYNRRAFNVTNDVLCQFDTVRIYRHDTCIIVWSKPFRYNPKIDNHFYNVNAWTNKGYISTFAILPANYYTEN